MQPRQIHFQILVFATVTLLSIGLTACASNPKRFIFPDVSRPADSPFRIKGKISYEGNRDYLPRTILAEAVTNSSLSFQYNHATSYGMRDVPALMALFNPLTFFGSPLGENTVTSVGRLSVIKGNETVKFYSALCSIELTRNLFSEGFTFSEMRRESLIAVRDNIESQLYQDREFLTGLTHPIPYENRQKIESFDD
jgi:hypothetical protein